MMADINCPVCQCLVARASDGSQIEHKCRRCKTVFVAEVENGKVTLLIKERTIRMDQPPSVFG
jgi:phage FluMu protein Com